jgi:cell division protein FtsZ
VFQPGERAMIASAIACQAVATGAFIGATAMAQPAGGQSLTSAAQQPRYDVHGTSALAAEPVPPMAAPAMPPLVRPGALRSEASRPMMPPRVETRPATEEPFIAPRPMEPDAEPALAAPAEKQADPFAAAAVTNGYQAPPRPEKADRPVQPAAAKPSLFERVTRRVPAAPKQAAAPAPRVTAPTPPAAPQQPRLGALDPGDRLSQSQTEDDLLDIPAFLRRQAN